MNVTEHILVPVDFTEKNQKVIECVRHLATPGESHITLLHVVEAITNAEDDPLIGFYRSLEENAVHHLEGLAKPLRAEGFDVNLQVHVGKPARKIVTESSVIGATLIVLSSHPLSEAASSDNWATVSYQVSIFCRCPVLLVK